MDTDRPSCDATEFEDRLRRSLAETGIPPRPQILEEISAQMQRDTPDLRRLQTVISADVSISGSLIKLVNSPFYGVRKRVGSVQDALVLLGLDAVAGSIATIVLRELLPAPPRLERFWDASARIARVSAWLVQEVGVREGVQPKDAYTFGLFRDCGIPIMLRKFAGYHDTLARANGEPARPFTAIEDEAHPTNHAVVGSLLAQTWWLAEDTSLAIRHHHDYPLLATDGLMLSPRAQRMIALSQLAEWLVQQVTGQSQTLEWAKMSEACQSLLALDDAALGELERGAAPVIQQILFG